MKYLGTITDPKDLTTKKYVDDAVGGVQTSLTTLSGRVDTNEDNIAMAESDIEGLQGDVGTLKTNMTVAQGAIKTLQDTYVPNTRKVNNKALSADITLTAGDIGALPDTYKPLWTITGEYDVGTSFGSNVDKSFAEINTAINDGYQVQLKLDINTDSGIYTYIIPYLSGGENSAIEFGRSVYFVDSVVNINVQILVNNRVLVNLSETMSHEYDTQSENSFNAKNSKIVNLGTPTVDTDAATKAYVDGSIKDSNVHLYQINSPSIPTSAWVTNTNSQAATQEKTDYPYMATISITNPAVTTNDIARVVFGYTEQVGGNFAPNCYTTTNGVIIEAKTIPSAAITLDYILIERIL